MIPNDQPLRAQTIKRMIDVSLDKEDITEWERDFLQSINEQFTRKNNLSDRQCEILEEIYGK